MAKCCGKRRCAPSHRKVINGTKKNGRPRAPTTVKLRRGGNPVKPGQGPDQPVVTSAASPNKEPDADPGASDAPTNTPAGAVAPSEPINSLSIYLNFINSNNRKVALGGLKVLKTQVQQQLQTLMPPLDLQRATRLQRKPMYP